MVRRALRRANDLTLGELCDLLHAETGTRIAVSTMCALVNRELRLTRKRKARGLPRQALTARNVAWRRHFVARWFGRSADRRKVATGDEYADQRHWRVQLDGDCPGAAVCERDGCRHLRDALTPGTAYVATIDGTQAVLDGLRPTLPGAGGDGALDFGLAAERRSGQRAARVPAADHIAGLLWRQRADV